MKKQKERYFTQARRDHYNDLLLLSPSEEHESLLIHENDCKTWNHRVNRGKSKLMIFQAKKKKKTLQKGTNTISTLGGDKLRRLTN